MLSNNLTLHKCTHINKNIDIHTAVDMEENQKDLEDKNRRHTRKPDKSL